MSTNFFAQQDRARSKTSWLVAGLIAAVVALVVMASLAVAIFIFVIQNETGSLGLSQSQHLGLVERFSQLLTPELVGSVAAVVLIIVVFASLYKLIQLRRGGKEVATALGGRLVNTDTRDADERKVLNVVEEMAIASGNPVPSVYLLEDSAINAFAAGFGRHDAVIGVTRGCIQQLDRDELQGVIAHEFSHVHYGDMRLNMRLVALLHGILIIGLIGYFVLRSAGAGRRKNAGAQLALGLGLIIIGYCGTFFGNMIKAAVSRQREFLADASAVQFTRNPRGIAGALKKIGGWQSGSKLQDSHASEYSHLYFANGVSQLLGSVLATHPPLQERIKRIDPRWDGEFVSEQTSPAEDTASPPDSTPQQEAAADRGRAFMTASAVGAAVASQMEDQIGNPAPEHIAYARDLLKGLPAELVQAAHEPYAARAIVYALLLSTNSRDRDTQIAHLQEQAHPATFRVIEDVYARVAGLSRNQHLPLLELTIPALKELSQPQHKVFKGNLAALIRIDKQVSLFEWALYRTLTHSIEEIEPKGSTTLRKQHRSCQVLLSVIAYAGRNESMDEAYRVGCEILELPGTYRLLGPAEIEFATVDAALDTLAGLKPLEKPRLLKAVAACIRADEKITPDEAELFRAIADSLDCPMPPLLAD